MLFSHIHLHIVRLENTILAAMLLHTSKIVVAMQIFTCTLRQAHPMLPIVILFKYCLSVTEAYIKNGDVR